MITLLLTLLMAHILGDFVFQPGVWVVDKQKNKAQSKYLYYHVGVHLLAVLILLGFNFHYWKVFLVISITHFLIDIAKLYLDKGRNNRILFLADQLAHIGIIILVVSWYYPIHVSFQWLRSPAFLLLTCSLLTVTFVAAIVVRLLINKWSFVEDNKEESLTNAGKYIGMLERLFVFGFIVLHQWSAIGFLIAAKSILRFSDLTRAKDRKLTEYVLVGTLLSFGIAIACGLIYLQLQAYLAL